MMENALKSILQNISANFKLNVVASFKVRKDDQYSLTPQFNKCHTGLSTNQTLVRNIQYNISEANGAII